MSMILLGATVLVTAAVLAVLHSSHARPTPPTAPVLDPRTELELRARYLNGQIGIDVYLDRRFGTAFASAGEADRAG